MNRNPVLDDIAACLARLSAPGAFAARRTAGPAGLRIDVAGVGQLRLPISPATARALVAVARPARYGLRDRTLLDRRVRDCAEIPRRRISVDERRWRATLDPQIERLGKALGIPAGQRLRAVLHNMLVYGPGQFFAAHQDSEKSDRMLGTLVVTLPSASSGGALVIEHQDERVSYRADRDALTFVAFYADCHHEVRPLRTGHRVALTYNLVLEGDMTAAPSPSEIEALARQLRRHFHAKPAAAADQPAGQPPDRLVYLLDHQYTRKGLAWHRLKRADALRAAALREAARQLDCEIFLALADVHESWSCEGDDDGYRYGGGYGRRRVWDDDENDEWAKDEGPDDDGRDDHTPALVDLCDSSVELRHWIGVTGKPEGISSGVDDDELCYTKASVEMEPFATEHEPYMGNYGNTVDRWYHRAAVVLWPRDRTFVIRAKASAAWGVKELSQVVATGATAQARQMASRLLPFWSRAARQAEARGLPTATIRVATALDDRELAAALLRPFALEQVTPKEAAACGRLLERYGLPWCQELFAAWAGGHGDRAAWLAGLPAVCEALVAGGGGELARWLLRQQWDWVLAAYARDRRQPSPAQTEVELGRLDKPLLGLLGGCVVADDAALRAEILSFVTSDEHEDLVPCLLGLLRAARASRNPSALAAMGLGAVHQHCTRVLAARLAAPAREPNDWSIATPVTGPPAICKVLVPFLASAEHTRLEWPLAQEARSQVHRLIDAHDLPVTHVTRRSGRPFTLVLTKTKDLFAGETKLRKAWRSHLDWLAKHWVAFAR